MAGAFTKRELFGGAIVAEVPEVFVDASDFRPVPSSQEVFVSSSTATDISTVIDILQRVDLPDLDACKEHFDDVIDGREGSVGRLFNVDGPSTEFPKFGANIPTYIVQGTVSSPYHPAPPPTDPSYLEAQKSLPYTLLLMAIFRLAPQKTDLVVTVNCPVTTTKDIIDEKRVWHPAYDHPPNGNGGAGAGSGVVGDAITLLKGVASTLEVRNWDLFSPED